MHVVELRGVNELVAAEATGQQPVLARARVADLQREIVHVSDYREMNAGDKCA